ncbi:MAG TPA: hypothetical protein GXX23_02655 [Firmicutes bacterium]|nr:hypothetical protein [Candidatus Fermentithermobacillaceae bacterium]
MVIQLPNSMSPNTAEAINSLLTSYNTENLRNSLMAYPTRIKAQRDVVNQARRALKDAELERATIEAETLLAIGTETDEKGKAKFSNAEARTAELLRRKSTDPRYLAAAEKVSAAEAVLNEAQDALQMLLDEYQSARIAARLIAAEMAVLSELIDVGEREEVSADGVMQVEIPDVPVSPKVVPMSKSKEAF